MKVTEIKSRKDIKNIKVITSLTVDNFVNAVHTIADSCFDGDTYLPEFKDIARRYTILKTFTNIDIENCSIEDIFILTQADWYYDIENTIVNTPIYNEILKSVDELIEYKIRTRRNSFDDLCDTLRTFADKMGDTNSLEVIANKISGISDVDLAKAIVNKDSDA